MDQERRRKRYHNKTLNGCITCKQRKAKCDETQPNCLRCITSNYTCAGYNIPQAKIFPAETPTLTAISRISVQGPVDDLDHRALSFSWSSLHQTFAGYTSFTHVLWSSLVPQLSHSEPAVRYIAFAIAMRQKLIAQDEIESEELRASCVLYHSRAIQALTQASQVADTAIILVCCIAFIAFERLDNIGTSRAQLMNHFDAGTKILKEHAGKPSKQSSDFDLIVNFIEPMFFQISFMFNMFRSPQTMVVTSEGNDEATTLDIPDHFNNLVQAKEIFHRNCWLHCYLMKSTDPWPGKSLAKVSIHGLLAQWGRAMNEYTVMSPDRDQQQKRKAADLKAQADVFWVAIEYSLRGQGSASYYCSPVRIDLRPIYRTRVYFQISCDHMP